MGSISSMLIAMAQPSMGLGEALAGGIPADRFARLTSNANGAVQTNHPAWVYGHLALYPHKALELLGDDPHGPPAEWDDLFGNGSELVDDADGSRYPGKDELVGMYLSEMKRACEILEGVSDEQLLAEQPVERWRERMPTVGGAFTFLLGPHAMFHLGQLSAWRRCEGMGSAM